MNPSYSKRSIVAAISGNFVEWYDFALYLFLAPVIAQQFFPDAGKLALLGTFTVHAVSFFFRPLGAILFGHIGDKYGRRHALRISLSCLATLSVLIACLPNTHTIGITATILLCLCRIGQGICLGGEFAGSMIYLSESAPPNRRALFSSLSNNGSNFGIICAALSATLLSSLMSETAFATYGYRFLFLFGGIVGIVGFAFRSDLKETPPFNQQSQHAKLPILTVVKDFRANFAQLSLVIMISALGSYAFVGYLSTFLHQSLSLSLNASWRYESLFLALTLVMVPIFATRTDKMSPKRMLRHACWGYIILALPCFYLLYTFQQPLYLVPLILVYSMEQSCVPALMPEYFPVNIRYTGVSLTYNVCMAFVGGLSPLVAQLLINTYEFEYALPYLLILGAALSIVCLKRQPSITAQSKDLREEPQM